MNRILHIALTIALFALGLVFVLIALPSDSIGKFNWQIGAWGIGAMALAIAQIPLLFGKG